MATAIQVHSNTTYGMKPPAVKGLPMTWPCRVIAQGPSGCGKSCWLADVLIRQMANFERVYVWSPSVFLDDTWQAVRDYSETLGVDQDKEKTFFDSYEDDELRKVIDQQMKVIMLAKKMKLKIMPQIAIVVDDFADDPRTLHANNSIGLLFIRGRHGFINAFVGCQKLTLMSPVIRTQATGMAIWRVRNGKELATIVEELSALYPANVIKALYEKATEEPHSFLWVNLMAKKKDDMFWRNFGERLLVHGDEEDTAWGSPRT